MRAAGCCCFVIDEGVSVYAGEALLPVFRWYSLFA